MVFHKNRLFCLLLSLVALCPLVAGDCLHLFFACPDKNCSSREFHDENHENCSHDHSADHQNQAPAPVTPEKASCFICKFLAIPRVTVTIVGWLPETSCLENLDVVFLSFDVTIYQNFELGRAPPLFV